MKILGGTIAADGATVHGEPIANFVTKVASMPKPVHLKILNAKKHIAEGGSKNADFMAEGLVTEIRLLPDGGIHVVLLIGDTASDEVLAARQVISVLPWISYAPCAAHVLSLILKLIAGIPAIAEWLEVGPAPALPAPRCLACCLAASRAASLPHVLSGCPTRGGGGRDHRDGRGARPAPPPPRTAWAAGARARALPDP